MIDDVDFFRRWWRNIVKMAQKAVDYGHERYEDDEEKSWIKNFTHTYNKLNDDLGKNKN